MWKLTRLVLIANTFCSSAREGGALPDNFVQPRNKWKVLPGDVYTGNEEMTVVKPVVVAMTTIKPMTFLQETWHVVNVT